ncbi:hypothetical protein H1R20_g14783, partial [Candolleomyces eurysporus]
MDDVPLLDIDHHELLPNIRSTFSTLSTSPMTTFVVQERTVSKGMEQPLSTDQMTKGFGSQYQERGKRIQLFDTSSTLGS